MAISREDLKRAAALAQSGDWDGAHKIVQQDEADPLSCWLHACLHKIEGDTDNARYWYARSGGRAYTDHHDPRAELAAIAAALKSAK